MKKIITCLLILVSLFGCSNDDIITAEEINNLNVPQWMRGEFISVYLGTPISASKTDIYLLLFGIEYNLNYYNVEAPIETEHSYKIIQNENIFTFYSTTNTQIVLEIKLGNNPMQRIGHYNKV